MTTLNRFYMRRFTPTWGHSEIRINKFKESKNIWVPLPWYHDHDQDKTFLTLNHSETMHDSFFIQLEKQYNFASYALFLEANIDYHERHFETILDLVKTSGAISHGLMIIFGNLLYRW